MNPRQRTTNHEVRHALAAAAALLTRAPHTLASAKCFLSASWCPQERTDGRFGLSIADAELNCFATSCAALAPGITVDTASKAIFADDLAPAMAAVSEIDREAFAERPVDTYEIVVCGLAADYYLQALGKDLPRYLTLVDDLSRHKDNLLSLTDFIDRQRLNTALAKAKAFHADAMFKKHQPEQHKAEALRKSYEFKRQQYQNASPAEREIRDRMGIGKTIGVHL